MHQELSWGWFVYLFQITQILFVVAAVWLIVDAARPKRRKDDVYLRSVKRRRVPLVFYQIVAGLALILHLVAYLPNRPEILTMISLLASPALIFLLFAYLLNVVFYKKTAEEAEQLLQEKKNRKSDKPEDIFEIEEQK